MKVSGRVSFEDLYKPEFRDVVKESRLLTKLSGYLTGKNLNPILAQFLIDHIKTHQIHFTEMKYRENLEEKRDRLYIESSKIPFLVSSIYEILKFQLLQNKQKDTESINNSDINSAIDILLSLANLDSETVSKIKAGVKGILEEREFQISLTNNSKFKITLLQRFHKNRNVSISEEDMFQAMSSSTFGQTPVGIYLAVTPEIAKNFFGFGNSATGKALKVEFQGRKVHLVVIPFKDENTKSVSRKVLEHESQHIIFEHISKSANPHDIAFVNYDLGRYLDLDFLQKQDLLRRLPVSEIKFALSNFDNRLKNELSAMSMNIPHDYRQVAERNITSEGQLDKNFDKTFKKTFASSIRKLYIDASYWPESGIDKMLNISKEGRELASYIKERKIAEFEKISYRLIDLLIKYPSFVYIISFTVSTSNYNELGKILARLEVFLEKYSKSRN